MLQPDATYKLHLIAQIINVNCDEVNNATLGILAQMGDVIDFGHNPFNEECSCELCAEPAPRKKHRQFKSAANQPQLKAAKTTYNAAIYKRLVELMNAAADDEAGCDACFHYLKRFLRTSAHGRLADEWGVVDIAQHILPEPTN